MPETQPALHHTPHGLVVMRSNAKANEYLIQLTPLLEFIPTAKSLCCHTFIFLLKNQIECDRGLSQSLSLDYDEKCLRTIQLVTQVPYVSLNHFAAQRQAYITYLLYVGVMLVVEKNTQKEI